MSRLREKSSNACGRCCRANEAQNFRVWVYNSGISEVQYSTCVDEASVLTLSTYSIAAAAKIKMQSWSIAHVQRSQIR
jgi:hypothetical protein